MKRSIGVLAILAFVGVTYTASAHDMSKHAAGPMPPTAAVPLPPAPSPAPAHEHAAASKAVAPASITGEIVDAGCYLGHAERGAKHADCAKQCIAGGMPMCLLTKEGDLYMLTMNHENAGPYNKLKTMAGKTVTVTGMVMVRNGMKGIDVASMKAMVTQVKTVKHEATKS